MKHQKNTSEFGNKLKRLLKELNLNQFDFAKKINVNKNAVSAWITGKYLPNLEIVERIYKLVKDEYSYLDRTKIDLLSYLIGDELKIVLDKEKQRGKLIYERKIRIIEKKESALNQNEERIKLLLERAEQSVDDVLGQAEDLAYHLKTLKDKIDINEMDLELCEKRVKEIEEIKQSLEDM